MGSCRRIVLTVAKAMMGAGVPELGHRDWPGVLGGWFVFVDQAAEDGSAFDPFRWGIGDRVVGPALLH